MSYDKGKKIGAHLIQYRIKGLNDLVELLKEKAVGIEFKSGVAYPVPPSDVELSDFVYDIRVDEVVRVVDYNATENEYKITNVSLEEDNYVWVTEVEFLTFLAGKVLIGRYLEDSTYYIGSMDETTVWVSVDGSEEFVPYNIQGDGNGRFFLDEESRVYLQFA